MQSGIQWPLPHGVDGGRWSGRKWLTVNCQGQGLSHGKHSAHDCHFYYREWWYCSRNSHQDWHTPCLMPFWVCPLGWLPRQTATLSPKPLRRAYQSLCWNVDKRSTSKSVLPFNVHEGNQGTQAQLDSNEPLQASRVHPFILFLSVQTIALMISSGVLTLNNVSLIIELQNPLPLLKYLEMLFQALSQYAPVLLHGII